MAIKRYPLPAVGEDLEIRLDWHTDKAPTDRVWHAVVTVERVVKAGEALKPEEVEKFYSATLRARPQDRRQTVERLRKQFQVTTSDRMFFRVKVRLSDHGVPTAPHPANPDAFVSWPNAGRWNTQAWGKRAQFHKIDPATGARIPYFDSAR